MTKRTPRPLVLAWLFAMIAGVSLAQENTVDRSVPAVSYFGQTAPGDTAVAFAPGIVAADNHEHSRLQFSPDGTEMFWAVIPVNRDYETTGGSPFRLDEQNIWYSKVVNGEWSTPDILAFTIASGGSSPAFSGDGELFYYRTRRPGADPNVRPRPTQLWKVPYQDGRRGDPAHADNLLPALDGKGIMSFCFAENGNLYFDLGTPDETGEWWWDIYFSEYSDGGYLTPKKMGGGINGGEASWCPWIAPDESYILYSSHRDGELGNGDLYINFRDENGDWSSPVNMGGSVNSSRQERFPSVTPDGKYLFFTRHVPHTFSDIYWVDASVIDALKKAR